jgi:hypothetical protein
MMQKASPVEKAEDVIFKDDIFNRPGSAAGEQPVSEHPYDQVGGALCFTSIKGIVSREVKFSLVKFRLSFLFYSTLLDLPPLRFRIGIGHYDKKN